MKRRTSASTAKRRATCPGPTRKALSCSNKIRTRLQKLCTGMLSGKQVGVGTSEGGGWVGAKARCQPYTMWSTIAGCTSNSSAEWRDDALHT